MQINLKSKQPIYLEICISIKKFISVGVLKPGDKLPSVRSLALELGINPNTVDRAYNILEEEKLITILPKKGAFVSSKVLELENDRYITEEIRMLKNKGVSKSELLDAIELAYEEEN